MKPLGLSWEDETGVGAYYWSKTVFILLKVPIESANRIFRYRKIVPLTNGKVLMK